MYMCRDCPDFCNECADDQICIKCQEGAVRLESGECASECPDLSYAAANGNCIHCHHSCLSCDGPAESNCTACPGQLSLGGNGTCSIHSPSSCLDGTYFDHRKLECNSCHVTCSKCSGKESIQCTHCDDPYTLTEDGRCVEIRQMQGCKSGHYFNFSSSSCVPCPPMCANCSGDATCSSCTGEYYLLSGGTCVETCPEHTVTDNQTYTCLDTACHKSCLACFGTKDSQCISCPEKMLLFEGSCVEKCPNATYETGRSSCNHCHPSCAECVGPDANQCLSCPVGTHLETDRCVTACPIGSFSGSKGVCLACPENCANSSTFNKCTTCSDGHFLLTTNGSCVNECPPGFTLKVSTRTCHPCLPNCIKCSSPSSCQKCANTFSYYELNRSCLVQCPDGFFTDSESVYSPCKSPCSTCSDSPSNCLGCERNFAMNLTSKTCERCCNADTNNAPCCDCNTNDDLCVWLNSLPTPGSAVDGGTSTPSLVPVSLFKGALIVAISLLIMTILLVAIVIGMRYLRRRVDIVKMPKLPALNGSQKYLEMKMVV